MIGFSDTTPDTSVRATEYQRLLGYPRERELDERAVELSDGARGWYATHGQPWVYARESQSMDVADESIVIDGVTFRSKRLSAALRKAGAHSTVLVAASAGGALEREAQRLWQEEKPDEYFFLEVYGSAVVEHLIMMAGARLCASADANAMAVLPHYSPGYPEWDIADQAPLLELMRRDREHLAMNEIEVLDSGMLRPKKSLLAVFGLTRHTDRAGKLTDLVPCENCTLPGCQYRRAAYLRPRRRSEVEAMR